MAKKAASKKEATPQEVTAASSKCPITREQFLKEAGALAVTIGEQQAGVALVKEFSTGSFGWYLSGKTIITVDNTPVKVQMNCSLVVVGSKKS